MSRIITRKQDGTMPTRLERWRATRGRVHYGITLANFTTLTEVKEWGLPFTAFKVDASVAASEKSIRYNWYVNHNKVANEIDDDFDLNNYLGEPMKVFGSTRGFSVQAKAFTAENIIGSSSNIVTRTLTYTKYNSTTLNALTVSEIEAIAVGRGYTTVASAVDKAAKVTAFLAEQQCIAEQTDFSRHVYVNSQKSNNYVYVDVDPPSSRSNYTYQWYRKKASDPDSAYIAIILTEEEQEYANTYFLESDLAELDPGEYNYKCVVTGNITGEIDESNPITVFVYPLSMTPNQDIYDKNIASVNYKNIQLIGGCDSIESIKNGETELTFITHYTTNDEYSEDYPDLLVQVITLKQAYLDTLPVGDTELTLTLNGSDFTFTVTVTETALIPANDTFDKNPAGENYEDKATTVKAHTTLVVKNGANTLTLNTDYTLADNVVTLKKEYLATLSVGDVALSVILDDVPNTYTVTVEDTTV